ncbi:MAG TPA: hypothetical protein VEV62_18695, partial [Parafilimonas sp.]|nr:hypothetical protein [Parafilimonas sp.]
MEEENNIQEENFKENELSENISPPEPDAQPETPNLKHETENMEVHHHPQVEKKNFKEYFLEFLMIFLAVTMGFFAENFREYLHDERATTENMQSMVKDLKLDSTMFSTMLAVNEYSIHMTDTLVDMLSNKSSNTGHIYFLARNITAVADAPRPDTRTFDQMRTEGSLRLLENKGLVNDITSYYQSLEWFKQGNDGVLKRMDEVITANSAVFNGTVLKSMFSSDFINSEHNTFKIVEPN